MNGALVRSWMQKQGMRPEELAVKLDVSFSTVKSIMAGKKPYRHTVTVLASLMGVSTEDLLVQPKKSVGGRRATTVS